MLMVKNRQIDSAMNALSCSRSLSDSGRQEVKIQKDYLVIGIALAAFRNRWSNVTHVLAVVVALGCFNACVIADVA